MANPVTISGGPPNGLPLASTLDGTEVVAMDQGGETAAATTLDIAKMLPLATTASAGKMSAADKAKVDNAASIGIAAALATSLGRR